MCFLRLDFYCQYLKLSDFNSCDFKQIYLWTIFKLIEMNYFSSFSIT